MVTVMVIDTIITITVIIVHTIMKKRSFITRRHR